jgi:GIY-YIG catalytic domain
VIAITGSRDLSVLVKKEQATYQVQLMCGRGVMVAATDLKSVFRKEVPVRVRPPAPVFAQVGYAWRSQGEASWAKTVRRSAAKRDWWIIDVLCYYIRSVSEPAQTYCGATEDLKQRIHDHNAGKSKHGRRLWIFCLNNLARVHCLWFSKVQIW